MNKPFIAITFLFVGVIAGLLMGATLIERDRIANRVIDEAIVLRLPKDTVDLEEQLVYLRAEEAMLAEIYRQQQGKHETVTKTNAPPNPLRVRSRTQR